VQGGAGRAAARPLLGQFAQAPGDARVTPAGRPRVPAGGLPNRTGVARGSCRPLLYADGRFSHLPAPLCCRPPFGAGELLQQPLELTRIEGLYQVVVKAFFAGMLAVLLLPVAG
jgi:hypothetical protein